MQKIVLFALLLITLTSIVSLVAGSDFLSSSLAVVKDGTLSYDINNDGHFDHVETWVQGELIELKQDSNGDGKVDAVSRFRNNQELFQTEYDLDFDGNFDYRETWQENGEHRIEVLQEGEFRLFEPSSKN